MVKTLKRMDETLTREFAMSHVKRQVFHKCRLPCYDYMGPLTHHFIAEEGFMGPLTHHFIAEEGFQFPNVLNLSSKPGCSIPLVSTCNAPGSHLTTKMITLS